MIPIDIIKKYYKNQSESRDILISHGESVASKAFEIIKIHPEWDINLEFIYEASLLHDIGIYLTNAPSIGCFGFLPYICHGYLGSKIIQKENYPKHARICARHTGSGLTKEDILKYNIPVPNQDFLPETIEEKLVCFSDKFYSKGCPNKSKSIDQIRKSLLKYGGKTVLRFEYMLNLFLG